MDKCTNLDAHLFLKDFDTNYQVWEKNTPNDKLGVLTQNLQYFQTYGIGAGDWEPVDIGCKRFLLKVEGVLSKANSRFRFIHDNYWDTWGRVVGILLSRKSSEKRDDETATAIFESLKKHFSENTWNDRRLAMKGFEQVANLSVGYDEHLWERLTYFYDCCEGAISGLHGIVPLVICDSVLRVVNAQNSIAERYAKGTLDVVREDEFPMKLITLLLRQLQLINRLWKSLTQERRRDILKAWRQTVFEHMFHEELLTSGQKIEVTKEVIKAFYKFFEFLQHVRRQKEYADMYPYLDHWLEKCKRILPNMVDPKRSGHE